MVQTKEARKGDEINLVVLPFSSPMDEVKVSGSAKVIGGIELANLLIVPWLAKFQQLIVDTKY